MANDYFLDSATGNDKNAGTAPAAPWQTLAKLKATTFQPGDRILLKAGGAWTGMLHPLGSGKPGAPITLGSFGAGAKPTIDGGGAEAAVLLEDQQHWVIEDLELRNTTDDRMVTGYLSGKHKAEGKETQVPGLRSGIVVRASGTERLTGLRIAGCDIHSIQGSSWRLAQPGMYDNAGIYVRTEAPFDNVLIENNHVHDLGTIGIIVWVGTGPKTQEWASQDSSHWGRGLIVRNNRLIKTGADGIIVGSSDGALIDGNVCYDAGANAMPQPVISGDPRQDVMHIAGIWCIASQDAVFQDNECARVRVFEQPADSMAFDVDVRCRGTITFQQNYTHDNPAGTLMIMNWNPDLERVIYRYNISRDDGCQNKFNHQIAIVEHAGQMCHHVDVHNNAFLLTRGDQGCRLCDLSGVAYRDNILWQPRVINTPTHDVNFARDFVWGAATAAYQIEGAVNEDGRGLSVWDMLCRKPGAIWNGQNGAVACDHYHRMQADVAMMKQLGLRGYRFSVSWPRVLPDGVGRVNEKGLAFYDRLVDELLAAGIQPWLTLFHWDYPHELFCRGGWLNRDSIDWFAEYTRVVAERLSDRVTHWMTFNEPQMFLALGHVAGVHAPGVKYADAEMLRVCHHAFCAHGKAVQALRAAARKPAQIGFAPAAFVKIPPGEQPADIELARAAMFAVTNRGHFNNAFYMDPVLLGRYPEDHLKLFHEVLPPVQSGDMELMHQPLDFLGANIYGGVTVDPRPNGTGDYPERPEAQGHPVTMMGWHSVPESLYWGPRLLAERYKLPIVITENGMSGHDWVTEDGAVHDSYRIHYTRQYLKALGRAIRDGVDVRGYFHWSLMDNFEWAEGYKQRFGLIHVDYATQKRTPKDSFDWYRNLIATDGMEVA